MPDLFLSLPQFSHQIRSSELFPVFKKLSEHFPNQITCVGGSIRDAVLGLASRHFDLDLIIQTPDLVWPISVIIGNTVQHAPFWLDPERKITRIQWNQIQLDINAIRANSLKQDAGLRDFTINTLMISLEDVISGLQTPGDRFLVHDYQNGVADLQTRTIKMCSPTSFLDDPLRILRFIRWKGTLQFDADTYTISKAREALPMLPSVAGERIREEWIHLLHLPDLVSLLFWCDRENLFGSWFPFISLLKNLDLQYTNPISVREHTLHTLGYLEQLIGRIQAGLFPHAEKVWDYCQESWVENRPKWVLLKMGALLHDIGKAETVSWEEDRLRFFGHEEAGIALTEPFLDDQGWSRREIDFIEQLIRVHMRPHGLSSLEYVTPKAQFRFFRDLEEAAIGSLILALADAYATRMIPMNTLHEYEQFVSDWLDFAYSPKKNIRKPLMNGDEIMEALQIDPSPLIKTIINELMEQESLGNISTKAEAINFLKHKKWIDDR